jgi:hypothetical protein
MKRVFLALTLTVVTLAGCAQLKQLSGGDNAPAGATGTEDQRPYPTRYKNDNFHPA